MKERDDLHQGKLADLRRDIALGVAQADNGQTRPFDEEATARIKARGRAKLAAGEQPGQA